MGKRRVDESEQLRFARTGQGERVHILVADDPDETEAVDFGKGIADWALAGYPLGVTRCGVTVRLGNGGDGITVFHDDDFCQRCVYSLPEDQMRLAFEHPQPGDEGHEDDDGI